MLRTVAGLLGSLAIVLLGMNLARPEVPPPQLAPEPSIQAAVPAPTAQGGDSLAAQAPAPPGGQAPAQGG
jgi:hypothetical protein